jgi:hypothetical protein
LTFGWLSAAVLKAGQRQLGAAPSTKWPTGARTHQQTAKLVGKRRQLLTTFCPIDDMTASAKGTVEAPGKNINWPD